MSNSRYPPQLIAKAGLPTATGSSFATPSSSNNTIAIASGLARNRDRLSQRPERARAAFARFAIARSAWFNSSLKPAGFGVDKWAVESASRGEEANKSVLGSNRFRREHTPATNALLG